MLQDNGYKPFDPFGTPKITIGGVGGSKLPPVSVGKHGVKYDPAKVGTVGIGGKVGGQVESTDPNRISNTGNKGFDDFVNGLYRDWVKPGGETIIGMGTDPVGSVGVAGEFYSDKLKELTGFSLDDIGIYALVFVLILIGVLGLLLPSVANEVKQMPIIPV